jgi:hypothetical protein
MANCDSLISFDQFEELLLAAQTPEEITARKAVLAVKKGGIQIHQARGNASPAGAGRKHVTVGHKG